MPLSKIKHYWSSNLIESNGFAFNHFWITNQGLQRFSRNIFSVLIYIQYFFFFFFVKHNNADVIHLFFPFWKSSLMPSTQPELQSFTHLIYEGGFGCRARWYVGLVQIKSPVGKTKQNKSLKWMWTEPHLCAPFPALMGHQEQCCLSGKSRPPAHYGAPPSDDQSWK